MISIIMVCHNQAEMTARCLESVLLYSKVPYELILIDNDSQDETPDVMRDIATRMGSGRVRIVTNQNNLGYPVACNQGLSQACGSFILFLNNDTLVTPRWLETLLSHFNNPVVGMVSPMSNNVPYPQRVPLVEIVDRAPEVVSLDRQHRYRGMALEVLRLSGFCLMVRRAVFNQIGPLDEQFGLGFFDDDDLCFRATDAGWKLRVALDVFIHHWGNQTFKAIKVNVRNLLLENFAKFQTKWGKERTADYRFDHTPIVSTQYSNFPNNPVS